MNKKQKWIKWLKHDLFNEIMYLHWLKAIYREISYIFENAKNKPKNNCFYLYRAKTHTAAVVAGIYRLSDKRQRNDVISLYKLLDEVKKYPQLVSRNAYTRLTRNLYRDRFIYKSDKNRLNHEFTLNAGKGAYINVSKVRCDIQKLERLPKKINTFRNKFIGHHAYNQRSYKVKPTLKEVHECIEVLNDIYRKYFLLITGGSIDTNISASEIEEDLALIFKNVT